ncbi:MAG TPA: diphosphate--fructose-6-phosphate 1-phosphotransferase, partial [bacterium]|nr:diphosphate--fructose-6-phosphate 1-phosphotransferase [bacterium]
VASATDVAQAIACGEHALKLAEQGLTGVMVTLQREAQSPYRWSLGHTDASRIANQEKRLPPQFIREDGYHITPQFRQYCLPLMQGEDYPPYQEGLPAYARLKKVPVAQKLAPFAGKKSE